MKLEKIEAGACDTGPNENCVSTAQAYSKKARKSQARTIPSMPAAGAETNLSDWKDRLVRLGFFEAVHIVGGDLGPIAAIGSPMVCVGFGPSWTAVWVCPSRMPWGWSDPYKLFLQPRSAAACKYAVKLAGSIRVAAEAEQDRRERHKAAVLREKFGSDA